MDEKIKGVLAYLFGWLGGVLVLFGFKDNSQQTKFSAYQSIVISVVGTVATLVLGFIPVIRYLGYAIYAVNIILRILGMMRSYQETDFEIPVVSELTREVFKSQLG